MYNSRSFTGRQKQRINRTVVKENPDTVIACPPLITEKVRQFDEHLETYTSGDYSEAQLRVDFLNPMIDALGWDVNNDKGYAEAYRDVVYEDAIKVGGTTKAPDYGFYIGGRAAGGGRKFFLEAKKPSVAIRVDPKSAFQLRRYAYSAQLPLSILTNFKEFIAYDTRFKPSAKDNARAAAVLTIKYTEYPERWHEIAAVFSRDAILRGTFDKFATGKRKKGMEPLGESFLKDIEGWRKLLASEIAKSNAGISVDDLNFAVQRTIDRILFLRICEDRGIEPAHNLMALLNGDRVYARLGQIFRGADDRYNSGIFHFPASGKKPDPDRAEPPDDLTLDLTIGDQPLKHIIRGLYDTGQLFTSYAFAVIPPEILGHVYEQFLGKVIRLTASHRVKIEEKPEVRKAGGVYYTPAYIVDYIVKNTVGKLLEDKSPKQAQKLRILDPASGSGSFLIGAYQFLLDWHVRWYLDNDPAKHCKGKNPALMRIHSPSLDEERDAPRTRKNGKYDYRLTTAKRKDILLNSIYGVDIDPQAVEVTKLSLLLKVLEGESQESINAQMKFLHQRALPDLGRNIKCGNSLIGDDFDDTDLSDDEQKKINRFNWQTAFPKTFKNGGFDAVIGNPPWLMAGYHHDECLEYFKKRYKSATGKFDLYYLFIEASFSQLVRDKGRFGMIVPNKFFHTKAAASLRSLLFDGAFIGHLVDFRDAQIFSGATNYSCILSGSKTRHENILYTKSRAGLSPVEEFEVSLSTLSKPTWNFEDTGRRSLFDRLDAFGTPLAKLTKRFGTGVQSGADRILVMDRATSSATKIDLKVLRRFIRGRDVRRYALSEDGKSLVFPYRTTKGEFRILSEMELKKQAGAWKYLKGHQTKLGQRIWFGKNATDLSGAWYGMMYVDSCAAFTAPHILTPALSDRARFTLGSGDLFATGTAGVVSIIPEPDLQEDICYLLGLLNSRLLTMYIISHSPPFSGGFFKFSAPYLKALPIRTIEFSKKSDKAAHDRMVKLVDRMLDLHGKRAAAKSPLDKERITRDIEATDRQIDKLVYDLYGLTEDEIRVVEEATSDTE